jgi:outer membrane lipoprotein carrier protein
MNTMYLKSIKPLVLALFFCGSLAANPGQDNRAKEILDKLAEQTTSAPSVFVDFSISISSIRDGAGGDEFDGEITIKGNQYRLSIMDVEIWFDGNSMYTYMPEVNEVIISDPEEGGGLMSNPAELFTMYHEEFRYRLIDQITRNGKSLYEIDLHPIDLDHDFHTVKLFIDRATGFIHSAVMAGKDGNRYLLEVNRFDNKQRVPDSYFVFDKSDYPGVEIIDMRW